MTATYIALEGPDGVGKSTVAAALQARLLRRTAYSTVRIRHFPTDMMIACANNGGGLCEGHGELALLPTGARAVPQHADRSERRTA